LLSTQADFLAIIGCLTSDDYTIWAASLIPNACLALEAVITARPAFDHVPEFNA
jgi:hypothetical protein